MKETSEKLVQAEKEKLAAFKQHQEDQKKFEATEREYKAE
jgi:hypothetical protein